MYHKTPACTIRELTSGVFSCTLGEDLCGAEAPPKKACLKAHCGGPFFVFLALFDKKEGVFLTLDGFFAAHPKLAVAFSGGADSAYLLWAAAQAGCQVAAY